MKPLLTLLFLVGVAHAQNEPCLSPAYFDGDGTYYGATGGGACSFDPSPGDLMVAAMNQPQYGLADPCGAYVEARGPKGTVQVRIVDLCPECKHGDLDFSLEAFVKIADQKDGRVKISWRYVPCPVSGAMSYRYKEGSTQWWAGVQVRNGRHRVAKFEYRKADGTFKALPRTNYNYFLAEGGMDENKDKAGPYTFRLTDVHGQSVVDADMPLKDASVVPGKAQFPVCGTTAVAPQVAKSGALAVWPNPFQTEGRAYWLQPHAGTLTWRIVDMLGREVASGDWAAAQPLPLDENLPAGVYSLIVETTALRFIKR